jgi:hypothetical protein
VLNTKVAESPPVIGEIHEVRATFAAPDLMQNAITQLEMSGFDRADLSLPEVLPPAEFATPKQERSPPTRKRTPARREPCKRAQPQPSRQWLPAAR